MATGEELREMLDRLTPRVPSVFLVAEEVTELRDVLAELERLRAWQAAALPIVEAVANDPVYYDEYGSHCALCYGEWDEGFIGQQPTLLHSADCKVLQAKDLLEPLNPK